MTTKRTKRATKPVAPKTALDAIRQLRATFLALDDDERSKLWDVLTALRGCDLDLNDTLKSATTGIIRTRVFGRKPYDFNRAMFSEDDTDTLLAERQKDYHQTHGTFHFKQHAQWAFDQLGLGWDKNNGPIEPV